MTIRYSCAAAALFVAALAAPATAQILDTVRMKEGDPLKGRIAAENFDGIEVRIRSNATVRIPWERVREVDYGGDKALQEALADISGGRRDAARARLEKLLQEGRLREPLEQSALFHLARLDARAGRTGEALARWSELLKKFPDGRYLVEGMTGVVDAALAKGDAKAARLGLDAAVHDAGDAARDPRFQPVVDLQRGRIAEAEGRLPDARARYDAADRSGSLSTEESAQARLGTARCFQAEGNTGEAGRRYRRIVEAEGPALTLAGAWNGLADLTLSVAVKARDERGLEQALYQYLRGVVQYLPADGDPDSEYRRALTGARQCCDYLMQVAKDDATKASFRRHRENLAWRLKQLDRK